MNGEREGQPGTGADVDLLMARARAAVREKLESGFYTPEEIAEVRRMELAVRERRDFGVDVDEGIAWLHANWDPVPPPPITSHRPLAGKLIVPLKKLAHRLLRPASSLVLMRQAQFNGQVTRLLTSSLHGVQGLEARFEDLLLKHYELLEEHRRLAKRLEELSRETDANRSRIASLRRPSPAPAPAPGPPPAAREAPAAPGGEEGFSYLAFEERHRGSSAELRERQRDYVELFRGGGPVLDAGCGRGEFLELLREAGIEARGVDLSPEMVQVCREKGLDAEQGDANGHLAGLPDGSLGGVFAAQVVEHLTTGELLRFVRLAHDKLAPGGRLVAETVNPACLATFAGAFYLDLTHVRPVHPEALRFLMEEAGFATVEILPRSPFPPEARLKEVDLFHRLQKFEDAFLNVVNDNFNQLNELIYGFQDYAAVGTR